MQTSTRAGSTASPPRRSRMAEGLHCGPSAGEMGDDSEPGALAELLAEDGVRASTRVADLGCRRVVVAGQVSEHEVVRDLVRVRVGEDVALDQDVAVDHVAERAEPARPHTGDREIPVDRVVLEGAERRT